MFMLFILFRPKQEKKLAVLTQIAAFRQKKHHIGYEENRYNSDQIIDPWLGMSANGAVGYFFRLNMWWKKAAEIG
jgi:hypothetical protein